MMKFIHLTDPHLMPPEKALYGLAPEARLTAAIDRIAIDHGDRPRHRGAPAASPRYALRHRSG